MVGRVGRVDAPPGSIRAGVTARLPLAVLPGTGGLTRVVDKRLVGIISIGDIVKTVLADREFAIRQLESYISGG